MKDLTGHNVKALQGSSRFVRIMDDEAVVVERYKGKVGLYVCTLERNVVRAFFAFEDIDKEELIRFLLKPAKGQSLVRGIRVGPMFRNKQVRHLVVFKKPQNDSFFIKVEPFTPSDAGWSHNDSGWVPVPNISHRAPGMVIFVRGIQDADLIPIEERYTKQGIFFLKADLEVYIEHVKPNFAFGKLVPRGV